MTHSPSEPPLTAQRVSGRFPLFSLLLRLGLPTGILIAGLAAFWILSVEPAEEKAEPVETQTIRTRATELHTGNYPVMVKTHGIVQPHNEVTLSARVAGKVTRINPAFEVGSYFSSGEVLVELDSTDYQTGLAVAEAQRLSAQSALDLATQVHERNAELFRRNVVSEAVLNEAAAAKMQAQAALDTASARLEQARRDLDRTTIRAPFDGRVRQKDVGVGQLVATGTPLGVVFAIDFAEIRLPIAGPELPFLNLPERTGDPPVEVELRDGTDKNSPSVWMAKIVRTEGALDEDSLELYAIARVDDPFGLTSGCDPLRIGQPVVASIAGKVLTDVVAIPRVAVRQLDQIYLVDKTDLTLQPKRIVPLWSDEQHIVVRDLSLVDGVYLALTRLVYAPKGAKVEIIPESDPAAEATAQADAEAPRNTAAVAN